jgi:hypothetical protein
MAQLQGTTAANLMGSSMAGTAGMGGAAGMGAGNMAGSTMAGMGGMGEAVGMGAGNMLGSAMSGMGGAGGAAGMGAGNMASSAMAPTALGYTVAGAAATVGKGALQRVLTHPVTLFGFGFLLGYVAYKYRHKIISSRQEE